MPVPAMPGPSAAKHDEGFLSSKDGLRLFWQRYAPPRSIATVAVLHGAGDHSGRFPGITTALVEAGCTAALLDFRGHGQSDGVRWHVDRFGEYLDDLDAFLMKLQAESEGAPLFIVGHSQGGLIAELWGLAHGADVSGFVLSAPFFALAQQPPLVKRLAGRMLDSIAPRLHLDAGLKMEQLTADPDFQRWTERDPLYLRACTTRWYAEVVEAQKEALQRAPEFSAPVLVLGAGADTVADTASARAFVEAARSSDKRFELYDGFRHELFNDLDRTKPLLSAVSWITRRASARPESR